MTCDVTHQLPKLHQSVQSSTLLKKIEREALFHEHWGVANQKKEEPEEETGNQANLTDVFPGTWMTEILSEVLVLRIELIGLVCKQKEKYHQPQEEKSKII